MVYQTKDMQADLMPTTTLGLDVMVGETGWARHAPHPLLLVGELAPGSMRTQQ